VNGVKETVLCFGAGTSLVGISTRGVTREGRAPGVVFATAGIVHRVGPNRLYVRLARRLAEDGVASLRFDLSGIGDSGPRADALPYAESSVAEMREAMDALARETGVQRFVLVGLCAGTLTAFRTALQDERVSGLVLLSPLLEDPATIPDDVVAETLERKIAHDYSTRKIRDPSSWLKLLRGGANYANIARVATATLRRPFVRSVPPRPGVTEALERIDRLARRRLEALLVFSEGTGVYQYYRSTLERPLARLEHADRVRVETLASSDHNFTALANQQAVQTLVIEWLQSHSREGSLPPLAQASEGLNTKTS
jgi:pimeloyl-ACP methyl ester carboxylesterase